MTSALVERALSARKKKKTKRAKPSASNASPKRAEKEHPKKKAGSAGKRAILR